MSEVLEAPASAPAKAGGEPDLPLRLHHNAWVVADQERTRVFYEDVLGFPLTQFWIETEPFEGDDIVLSHAFYSMADGSALAFFCLATPELHEKFKSPKTQIFNHFALKVDDRTQARLVERLSAAGQFHFVMDHGYCRSLYCMDPDGLRVEFAVDSAELPQIIADQAQTAHQTLKAWTAGERTSNNNWRMH